jgi:DoxX-like family
MRNTKRIRALLWTAQVLLALAFLFAGGMKLIAPAELLKGPVPLPVAFLRFIGACETLGAIGLVLPSITRIKPWLTPLAASGLIIIMTGATIVTLIGGQVAPALVPFTIGLLAVFVANGRSRIAPIATRSRGATYTPRSALLARSVDKAA